MLKKKGLLRSNGQPHLHNGHPHYPSGVSHHNNTNNNFSHQMHHPHPYQPHHPMHGGVGKAGGVILNPAWATAYQDPARTCGRCRSELGRIMNRGAFCRACKIRVCKSCREYGRLKSGGGNHDWLCTVCHKNM